MSIKKPSKCGRARRRVPCFLALTSFTLLTQLAGCDRDAEGHKPRGASLDAPPTAQSASGGVSRDTGGAVASSEVERGSSAALAINLSEPAHPRRRDRIKALFRATLGRLHPLRNFSAAKRAAAKIYENHRSTFYCACDFTGEGSIDGSRCGYVPLREGPRASKLEWEHVVPAHAFGGHRTCWTGDLCQDGKARAYKGRRCCQKRDAEFRSMEADLQNLVPEVGELNQRRSNFGFGEVLGEPRLFGSCDFEVDTEARVAEAEPSLVGDIARIYLYMYHAYPGGLPLKAEELDRFEAWHEQDPPTMWEKERNRRIVDLQGAGNPLLEESTP